MLFILVLLVKKRTHVPWKSTGNLEYTASHFQEITFSLETQQKKSAPTWALSNFLQEISQNKKEQKDEQKAGMCTLIHNNL